MAKTIPAKLREGYIPSRCAESVFPRGMRFPRPHQCNRKVWKDGWCKQHHPDTEAERARKSLERYEAKWQQSPHMRLAKALERIKELEAEVETLRSKLAALEGEGK